MSVYQVAIIFEAESDDKATLLAERLQEAARLHGLEKMEELNAKISFTKFEKEATEVAE